MLVIGGDFVQTAAGVLGIELGGLTQGVTYDFLQVTGNAVLDGVLNVTQVGTFVPSTGDNFEFMTFANRTGNFATFNFPTGSDLRPVPGATNYAMRVGAPFNPAAAGATIEPTNEARRMYDDFLELTPQAEKEVEVRPRASIICD